MARKPESGMDEEAIIRRRDDVPGEAFDEPLDAFTRRALSDSRLRALAFALGDAEGQKQEAEQIGDSELIAYLLDTLPEQARIALEKSLHGNARAFGRLMTLLLAFDTPTDKRDRQRANDPARQVGRHIAARIDIRRMGAALQFRDASRPRGFFQPSLTSALYESPPVRHQSRSVARMKHPMKRLPSAWGPKTEVMLRNSLQRAQRDLSTGSHLVEEALLLLDRWWNNRPRDAIQRGLLETPPDRETEQLRARLTELLRELDIVADRINVEFDDIASGTAGMFSPAFPDEPPTISYSYEPRFADGTVAARAASRDPESWSDTFDVDAGPWTLRLASDVVGRTPQLAVSLRANDTQMPSADPFLTLVQPNVSFDTVNLDASGSGSIALSAGDSVLLLQGDEVWEIRLSVRD